MQSVEMQCVENAECRNRSVENAECGKAWKCSMWKMPSVENGV